jgi:hypothetical protein
VAKQSIEYQKVMTEIVWVNLPGPTEPDPGMSGGELLHGFLAEIHRVPSDELRAILSDMCNKWNIRYKQG